MQNKENGDEIMDENNNERKQGLENQESKQKNQFRLRLDSRTLIDIFSKFDVVTIDSPIRGCIGEVNLEECRIYINGRQSPAEKKRTLLHELVHILADTGNIQLSEESVESAANDLYDQLYKRGSECRSSYQR